MATTRIRMPELKPGKPYDLFKQELLAWKEITDLDVKKQGIAVALSLPEDDNLTLRAKLFDQHSLDDLKKEDGLDTVLKFLDSHLGKDDLADTLLKYGQFEDYKQTNETTTDFIGKFEQLHNRLEKKSIKLPEEIKAYKLLRSASLTNDERTLVLSGIDYTKKDTLFTQAKDSLKKFKGDGRGVSGINIGERQDVAIKLEPAFYTQDAFPQHNAYYTGAPSYQSNFRGGRPAENFRGRSYTPPNTNNQYPRRFEQSRPASRGSYGFRSASSSRGAERPSWRGGRSGERPYNPSGSDGKPLRCDCCESTRHFLKDCPHSWENTTPKNVNMVESESGPLHQTYYPQDTGYIHPYEYPGDDYYCEQAFQTAILYTGDSMDECIQLQQESHASAVVDTACTSNVCGTQWMNEYIETLNDTDKAKVSIQPSSKTFKFGIGTAPSIGEYRIPVFLAGENMMLKTDVVDSEVPLLLSRQYMKELEISLNLVTDSAVIMGKEVPLNFTSSGHYCLPLTKTGNDVSAYVVDLKKSHHGDLNKSLLHIHRQMGHPATHKLVDLLKKSGSWEDGHKEILDKIRDDCNTCKKFARTPSNPVVSMPMANEFNQIVAMDLKQWKDEWILHMVDMYSRYTVSVFVSRKDSVSILSAVINNWVKYFGVMQEIFTDNGGEFKNAEMREVASVFNFKVKTSDADSPFQNGLCEKNHAIVDLILSKLSVDYPRVKQEVLLGWANMAKNSLQMWSGFSSNQLVFGTNPRLPNIMCSNLASWNETTLSETLAKHLCILHDARKAFMQSESDERIRRALRNRIRTSEAVYQRGDKVFYKREGRQQWLGPAQVVFQDRKIVLLDHGGYFIKVSPNRLVLYKDTIPMSSTQDTLSSSEDRIDSFTQSSKPTMFKELDDTRPDRAIDIQTNGGNVQTDDGQTDNPDNQEAQEQDGIQDAVLVHDPVDLRNQIDDIQREQEPAVNQLPNVSSKQVKSTDKEFEMRRSLRVFNKKHDGEVYSNTLNDNFHEAYVTVLPRREYNSAEAMIAKQAELDKLRDFDTYEVVDDVGQPRISTRFVLTRKNEAVRARLVARGFEEESLEQTDSPTGLLQTDSPTVSKSAMRMCITIALSEGWSIEALDIKSAFLQSRILQREVFVSPPVEANCDPGKLWKLKRCLYGLADAAREFYVSLKEELIKLGCEVSRLDSSLFFKHSNNVLTGVLVAHIDDLLYAGNPEFNKTVMEKVSERFQVGTRVAQDFTYVGLHIVQGENQLTLDQDHYASDITCKPVQNTRDKRSDLSPTELTQLRSIVGSLNWVIQGTRPDSAFEMLVLSTKLKNGTIADLIMAGKLVTRIKQQQCLLTFPKLKSALGWRLVLFTDASFGNLPDGVSSTQSYIILIVDDSHQCCPIDWRSNKCKRVARSTLAAETLALQDGLEAAIYVKTGVLELLPALDLPIIAKVDCKSLVEAVHSTSSVEERLLRLNIASIKQMMYDRGITVSWVPGEQQLADSMTKKGASGAKLLTTLQSGKLDKIYNF